MTNELNHLGMGARFIPAEKINEVDLGPLKQLVGQWESVVLPKTTPDGIAGTIPSGWNVISVPGGTGFVFEVIPYKENLKFSAVAVEAGNRGPVINGTQFDQEIVGLFYEQQIISMCDRNFCQKRGFGKGTVIHAETGLFLYIKNYSSGLNIARLGTVPHGNALLALGSSTQINKPGIKFIPALDAQGKNLDGSLPGVFGYNDQIIGNPQFQEFDQKNPNAFLTSTLNQILGLNGSIDSMTTFNMSTHNPNATGGILNIPFIQSNITATTMDATFWLENISGGSESELLQYSQTINLVFPAVGEVTPLTWPHITVSTLKRMKGNPQNALSNISAEPSGNTPGVPQL